MLMKNRDSLYMAPSLTDATAALRERGREGAALAGATWVMRAPLRHQPMARAYVALSRIEDLRRIEFRDDHIAIGASVTHEQLAAALHGEPSLSALLQAAAQSANPAVRRVATVGGNLCTTDFAAADLIPALLCLEADVVLANFGEEVRLPLAKFLEVRENLEPGSLVSRVIVPRQCKEVARHTAHARLPLRKAGDYPVAIVSLAVDIDHAGVIGNARAAVGSVEAVARRWTALEERLTGQRFDPQAIGDLSADCLDDFSGRDGVEAPGWYRVKVLPSLARRAAMAVAARIPSPASMN
jgi:carbon-monoxide dehydrogenase medium subunit